MKPGFPPCDIWISCFGEKWVLAQNWLKKKFFQFTIGLYPLYNFDPCFYTITHVKSSFFLAPSHEKFPSKNTFLVGLGFSASLKKSLGIIFLLFALSVNQNHLVSRTFNRRIISRMRSSHQDITLYGHFFKKVVG